LIGTPAAQLGSSFGHRRQTHARWIGIGHDADAVVVYFDGETVVRAAHPDSDALRAGVFCRVADRLLRDAVGRDLDRGGKYRNITHDLETDRRRVWHSHACTQFGVLLKGRQQASMVEGWWSKSFHQAANVDERGLLQLVPLL
jgi:hypothetical protein